MMHGIGAANLTTAAGMVHNVRRAGWGQPWGPLFRNKVRSTCKTMNWNMPIRALAVALPLSALVWAGCSKQAEKEDIVPEASFPVEYPALPVILDSATVAGPSGAVLELDNNVLAQALQAKQYTPGQLTEFTFTKARLYFSTPVNSSYNSVKSVAVKLAVGDAAPVTIAKLPAVPNGAQTLLLNLTGADVLQVVKSGHARIVFTMEFDGPMPPVSTHMLVLEARVKVSL